jgi:hypothetical protein
MTKVNFDPKSWTRLIALSPDDIVCYQSDLNALKTVINAVSYGSTCHLQFPSQLWVILRLLSGVDFEGSRQQQADINLARDNLTSFTT